MPKDSAYLRKRAAGRGRPMESVTPPSRRGYDVGQSTSRRPCGVRSPRADLVAHQKCHWDPVRMFLRTSVMRKVEIWIGSMMAKLPSRIPCPRLFPCWQSKAQIAITWQTA